MALLVPTFSGAQPGQRTAPLALPPAQTPGSIKILVDKDGWHKVTASQLQALGFTYPALPPDRYSLHLYKDGTTEVPIRVRRNWIEFYGERIDGDDPVLLERGTDTRTYWLVDGAPGGPRIPNLRSTSSPGSPSGSFLFSTELKRRVNHVSTILNGDVDNWFGNSVFVPQKVITPITATNVETSLPGTLFVKMQGASSGLHTISVQMNPPSGPVLTGTVSYSDLNSGSATFTVPAGGILEGTNSVGLTSSAASDFNYSDTLVLTYPHRFLADNNSLTFAATAATPVTVGGFTGSDIRMVDITNPLSPRELTPSITPDGSAFKATLNPPAGTTKVHAFLSSGALAPKSVLMDTASNLRSPTGARLLVISYGPFLSNVMPLVTFRQSAAGGSWSVIAADVQDVYDEFAGGAHTTQAIIDYLSYARANYVPAPDHVLLVGDASFDPRNFSGNGITDFVPTKMVDSIVHPPAGEVPGDDSLAPSVVSPRGQNVPTMGVGRIPSRSAAETTAIVNKILNYQQRPVRNPRDAFTFSDNSGTGGDYDFHSFSVELEGTLESLTISPPITVTEQIRNPADATATRTTLLNNLNTGPTIVNFFGHGLSAVWTNAQVLRSTDAPNLTNVCTSPSNCPLSLYLAMTCLNGYFVEPSAGGDGLAEALVKAPGGAVASWASSGETFPGGPWDPSNTVSRQQRVAVNVALDALVRSSSMTLGQAMMTAKNELTDTDVIRTWNLFGDPTLTLR